MNRYDHQAQLTFHYAREEANLLGHAQVGPEHILLGLMRAGGGGRDVLTRLGAELAWMREQFNELSPADRKGPLRGIPAVTPFAHQVMEAASQQAQALGASITSTSHILLGILSVGEPLTQRLLTMIQPDLQAIVAGARTVAPPSPAEAQVQAQEQAERIQALRHLLEETVRNEGILPAGMTEDELAALIVSGGDASLSSLFEDVVYRWVTGDRLSENRKHAVLLQLIHHAMQNRG